MNQALLFDLARDPLERQDLAAEHPEVVQRMKRRLEERRAAATAPLAAGFAEGMDESVLRALGY